MKIESIIKIMKFLVLIAGLLLLLVLAFSGSNDCDKCNFEIEGKEYDTKEFMSYYWETCFPKYDRGVPSGMNFSGVDLD